MITYYLTLSETFPKGHWREGQRTEFEGKLLFTLAFINEKTVNYPYKKLHTIRANYRFWAKRFEKIAAGEACLSIRQWVGKPYGKGSKQREIVKLTREDGIGIQCLRFPYNPTYLLVDGKPVKNFTVASNDGLNYTDWSEWFKNYDRTKPMAIIHFTNFRY